MHRLQNKLGHLAASCGASILLIAATLHPSALAQNVAAPAAQSTAGASPGGCDALPMQVATEGTVTISPQRGWQMENRDIEVALTAAKVAGDPKPLVCFRWKLKGVKEKFVKAEPVRIVQRAPASQQPLGLRLAATVPYLGLKPARGDVFYTPDNAAPIAEVRILLLGADDKPVVDVTTTIAVVAENDYCNIPNVGVRTDSGTVVPSDSKNWQPVGGEIEFTAKASKTIPSDALIKTCFRWKLIKADPGPLSDSGPIRVLERQPNMTKLAVTVPKIGEPPSPLHGEQIGYSYAMPFIPLVPEADVRVLLFDADLNPVFDA